MEEHRWPLSAPAAGNASEWPFTSFSMLSLTPTNISTCSTSTTEVTAGNDGSSFLSRTGDDSVEVRSGYWVRVGNLGCGTTNVELKKLFYPYGGDEAFTVWDNASGLIGFVGFELSDMAAIATEKMNAFIPCRQSVALDVRCVSRKEAEDSRARSGRAPAPVLSMSVPRPQNPERILTDNILQSMTDPPQCALSVVEEVARATPGALRSLLTCLLSLSTQEGLQSVAPFFDELLKELLRHLLEVEERPVAESSADGAVQQRAVVNCGAVLGNLFAMHIYPGDPFLLATRLLQRTGGASVAQVNGICAIAHACHSLPFPISKASFWALVSHTATETSSPQMRDTLLAHLRQLRVTASLPSPSPFSTQAVPQAPMRSTTLAQQKPAPASTQADDSRARTVHVSHLPPHMPQKDFMSLLTRAGTVNKVRLCIGNGYTTLFAFVEMGTVRGAQSVVRMLNNVSIMGLTLRVQWARNPIQDFDDRDAASLPPGCPEKRCTFGTKNATLASSAICV